MTSTRGEIPYIKKEVLGLESLSLFNNPLISEEDLQSPDGYQYDPEIINNIDKFANSDTWYCKKNKCNVRDDKWTLMRHNCRYRNIKNENEEEL